MTTPIMVDRPWKEALCNGRSFLVHAMVLGPSDHEDLKACVPGSFARQMLSLPPPMQETASCIGGCWACFTKELRNAQRSRKMLPVVRRPPLHAVLLLEFIAPTDPAGSVEQDSVGPTARDDERPNCVVGSVKPTCHWGRRPRELFSYWMASYVIKKGYQHNSNK